MRKLSFVIPCYCSEKTISSVVARVVDTVEKDGRYDYEIICVNDASKDNTFNVLKLLAKNKKIKVVNFSKNYGQHAALMAGFHQVEGDIVVCLDDDGQNPPEEMFKLIDKLDEGYDLVSAKYENEKRGIVRKLGSKVSFAMSEKLIQKPKDIDLNSYYVFRSFILNQLLKYDKPYPFVHGLILQITHNMANVVITHNEREEGKSGYNLKRLFNLWMNGFTAFSEKPLRIASYVGVCCSLLGFLIGIIMIIRKLINPLIPAGYTSLIASIFFVGGIIMLFLGLLGEYIGRMYISINNAPQYAIKETINIDTKE